MDSNLLRDEEKAVFALRELYGKYGYLPYRMSRFEEYELYIRHKEFMVSDQVIAFNDTNGRMMALKPDVTLSIIKSGADVPGVKQKVYYNENVYRVSASTHCYKEIMQAGLECIGDIGIYDFYEVISLAAESLAIIDRNFVLEVSQLGILSGLLDRISADPAFRKEATMLIEARNGHDLKRLCEKYGVGGSDCEALEDLIHAYGDRAGVIEKLEKIAQPEDLKGLKELSELLDRSPYSERIRFDFSLAGNTNYYNGYAFKGFVDGIESAVLSGGQYDRMMEKMGRSSGAIGFAIYLDLLSRIGGGKAGYDVDFLILYDDGVTAAEIAAKTAELMSGGFSCSAQKAVPEKLRYKEIVDMREKTPEGREEKKC